MLLMTNSMQEEDSIKRRRKRKPRIVIQCDVQPKLRDTDHLRLPSPRQINISAHLLQTLTALDFLSC